ncbi:MAG: FAD/NAD(P)-binding protein [Candidatus Methanoperedens sp.]|nr:FAD/NAD(P)-binding protein [Candidatus Methanoperedens sp.]
MDGSIYLPVPAIIKNKQELTHRETLLEIAFLDDRPLGHMPGQFVEVSFLGIGEAPISVASSPTKKESFELCVRAVGNVTKAIHNLKTGDKIGIRGPFGKGFDTEFLKGKDLLIICGGLGIVPLRSLIYYVLNNSSDFGQMTILYGCKEPHELLFKDELVDWADRGIIHLTADRVAPGEHWYHNIGVITTLVNKVDFDPANIYALIVGPPIMYKFVILSLNERKIPDDHIFVSLERRMKCGLGKCGHCQINGVYVCRDGPVFNYQEIKNLPEAL